MASHAATNILLTGLPRSGTTLSCHLLNSLPDTVALHEPMRVKDFALLSSRQEICESIEHFCAEQRQTLHIDGRGYSKQQGATVPTNSHETFRVEGTLRQAVVSGGNLVVDKALTDDFVLVIKHISAFAAICEDAVKWFPVFALVRNPLAVLASWNSIDFAFRLGHAPAAERLDPGLAARLGAIGDRVERELALLDWFFAQFSRHIPAANIIRYETLVETGGRTLSVVHPAAASLSVPLVNHNANPLYDREGTLRMGERLLQSKGAYWDFYGRTEVETLLEAFASGAPCG